MKKTVLTLLGAAAISVHAQNIIDNQNFETGLKPPEFDTWNSLLSFPGCWDYQPALDGKFSFAIQEAPGFDIGAFWTLPEQLNNLTVSFKFRCPIFPDEYGLEVVDLYDADGNEIADVYLDTTGQLSLTIGGSIGSTSKAIPLNRTITISLHFDDRSSPGNATLTWSQPNSVFGGQLDGVYRTDGNYSSAVARILFGPVEDPVLFIYDDLVVTTP